jgi:hypothetical protein
MPDTDLCIDTVLRQETMTISAYQIDNILKAYSRQSKIGAKSAPVEDVPKTSSKYADVVSLSSEQNKQEVYDKISYSLMDVLLKGDKPKETPSRWAERGTVPGGAASSSSHVSGTPGSRPHVIGLRLLPRPLLRPCHRHARRVHNHGWCCQDERYGDRQD